MYIQVSRGYEQLSAYVTVGNGYIVRISCHVRTLTKCHLCETIFEQSILMGLVNLHSFFTYIVFKMNLFVIVF